MSEEIDRPTPDDDRPLPVLASPTRVLEPPRRPLPLAAPVLAATGGFLAGVATFLLTRVLRRGRARRRMLARRRSAPFEITASRSFLVDIHVLKR